MTLSYKPAFSIGDVMRHARELGGCVWQRMAQSGSMRNNQHRRTWRDMQKSSVVVPRMIRSRFKS